MTFSKIDSFGLKVHQIVRFTHDLKELPDEIRGPFEVLSDAGESHERGHRLLRNAANKLVEYSPLNNRLGNHPLPWGYKTEVRQDKI